MRTPTQVGLHRPLAFLDGSRVVHDMNQKLPGQVPDAALHRRLGVDVVLKVPHRVTDRLGLDRLPLLHGTRVHVDRVRVVPRDRDGDGQMGVGNQLVGEFSPQLAEEPKNFGHVVDGGIDGPIELLLDLLVVVQPLRQVRVLALDHRFDRLRLFLLEAVGENRAQNLVLAHPEELAVFVQFQQLRRLIGGKTVGRFLCRFWLGRRGLGRRRQSLRGGFQGFA